MAIAPEGTVRSFSPDSIFPSERANPLAGFRPMPLMLQLQPQRSLVKKTIAANRCTTGVEGLDEVLGGGLPNHRLYLVQGDPGVGKTTLGLQFLLEGARLGQRVLYITMSETKEELQAVADSHGFDLAGIDIFELSAVQEQIGEPADSTFFRPSEVELNRLTEALTSRIKELKPSRIVFDSLSEMRLLAETSLRYRRQVLAFKQFFSGGESTVLFLDDCTAEREPMDIESIAHGVITLRRISPEYGIARRQVNIQKVRGVKFREGNHDLILRRGGMVVFPRLVAAEHHVPFAREAFPSGIPGLDALLGGGLDRGTSTMFMGPPGTGKSTLALHFVYRAALRGERALVLTFDETLGTLLGRSRSLGMDLQPFIEKGLVQVEQINPAEISPGEMAHRIRGEGGENPAPIVVIDSINGYLNAMPAERHLDLQLHELLAFLNQHGVITIMILAQQGIVGSTMHSAVDLTYLADTVVLMRYYEHRGSVKQAISIIKKRSGNHERTIREININGGGIDVGVPLTQMQGVLTGVPSVFEDANGGISAQTGR
jgi:circadian clock protein KaiC